MLTQYSPATFKTIPWKNGLGHTTELAISENGTLDNFDWRLSIASVVNDGDFSNFAGYQRNLVLIEGNGLTLDHRNGDIDNLTQLLDIARFDGGCNTHGALSNGGIKDFNIMTRMTSFLPEVTCYVEQTTVSLELLENDFIFAYSLTNDIIISDLEDVPQTLPVGHLAKIQYRIEAEQSNSLTTSIAGKNMIIIQLKVKACL
jgi:environmental stress-induced protein Ves